jgi:hypothetical protein
LSSGQPLEPPAASSLRKNAPGCLNCSLSSPRASAMCLMSPSLCAFPPRFPKWKGGWPSVHGSGARICGVGHRYRSCAAAHIRAPQSGRNSSVAKLFRPCFAPSPLRSHPSGAFEFRLLRRKRPLHVLHQPLCNVENLFGIMIGREACLIGRALRRVCNAGRDTLNDLKGSTVGPVGGA